MANNYQYSSTTPESMGNDYTHLANVKLAVYTDLKNENSTTPTVVSVLTDMIDKDIGGLSMDEMCHTVSALIIYNLSLIPAQLQASAKVTMLSKVIEQIQAFDVTDKSKMFMDVKKEKNENKNKKA